MARNSDGSYDAIDSGGFGKDYHGQDAFGEHIGGSGIGGSHFGGFEAGHFGVEDGRNDHYEREATSYGDITQTETTEDTGSFDGSEEEANEIADSMRDSLRDVNETAENSNTGSTMDTSFQIGGIEEDKEKYQQDYERAEEELNRTNEWASEKRAAAAKSQDSVNRAIDNLDNKSITDTVTNAPDKVIDDLASLADSYGFDFDRNKLKDDYKERGAEALRNASDELFERKKADIDKTVKDAQDRRDHFKSIANSYKSSTTDKTKSSTTDKTKSSFTDKMKPSTKADIEQELERAERIKEKELDRNEEELNRPEEISEEDIEKARQEWEREEEEDKERYKQELERDERRLNNTLEWADQEMSKLANIKSSFNNTIGGLDNKSITSRIANNVTNTAIDTLEGLAKFVGYRGFDRNKIEAAYKEGGTEALRNAADKVFEAYETFIDDRVEDAQSSHDNFKDIVESYESPSTGTKISFGMKSSAKPGTNTSAVTLDALGLQSKEDWEEMYKQELERYKAAKPGPNMSKATPVKSDYYTKANKDSTKEVPKETPSRNDFGNHAVDTLIGATDLIADNTTAKALGIQSLEDFANHAADTLKGAADTIAKALGIQSLEDFTKENGYDPNKLSTMKAYRGYQFKQIWKAVPGIVKQIGSYITERIKDAVDPSQLPERIRNTIARYNMATLLGAAILSIKSGAGLQASIDQALTMVDPEDQAAVSDYIEDVLNDEGTVTDLGNAFDDALAPEQNSATNELDESIINVGGRKDNTDYSGFNAGLGTSGTTSDADVKVFIARNVKADPILRKMIDKIGK